jgi:hypothetical protein
VAKQRAMPMTTMMARTLRAEPSALLIAICFCLTLCASPSSGCC